MATPPPGEPNDELTPTPTSAPNDEQLTEVLPIVASPAPTEVPALSETLPLDGGPAVQVPAELPRTGQGGGGSLDLLLGLGLLALARRLMRRR